MASIVTLLDITKCSVGVVSIARGTAVRFNTQFNKVQSVPNGRGRRSDPTYAQISASIQAEDPLSVPLVLALTFPQTILAGGLKVNAAAYQDYTLLHALLTGFAMNLQDNGTGTCSYDFQNRGPSGGSHSVELTGAAGTNQGLISREGTVRIAAAEFTDDASTSVTITGLVAASLQAKAQAVSIGASPGEAIADLVDITGGFDGTGTLTIKDQTLSSSKTIAQQLAALRRGTLTITVMPSGLTAGATAPDNKVITIDRVKFFDPGLELNSLKEGSTSVGWDWEMISSAGEELGLADMVAIADET